MKSILLFMPYGSVGGMERLALTFYDFYKQNGYKVKAVKIIRLETDIITFGEDEYALSDKDFSSFSTVERFMFYVKIPFLVAAIIRKEKITHSISFGDMANLFSSLTFTREYKIASMHAVKSIELAAPSFLNQLFRKSYRTTYYFLDKVVCISNAIKKDIIENCDFKFTDKLEVIYNPHNLQEIERLSALPIENQEEEKLFENDTIVFLGRMSIQKSPWHLVKAFAKLSGNNPNLKLVFIGDGSKDVTDWLEQLLHHFKIQDKVVFLGRKSNPYQYIVKAKVLALSSYYEGTPNVIVEAMALEVPVVSSNCTDGIAELMTLHQIKKVGDCLETEAGIITPNFYQGQLTIPKNFDIAENEIIFSDALENVLHNNADFKSRLAQNKAALMDKFDFQKTAVNYLKPITR
jgi:glycosyltransferase involved in cell wall biosynthesis